jgi:hypothetical protein
MEFFFVKHGISIMKDGNTYTYALTSMNTKCQLRDLNSGGLGMPLSS